MRAYRYISLQSVPSARLLLAFIIGIVLQWYTALPLTAIIITGSIALVAALSFFCLPDYKRYSLRWLQGTMIVLLLATGGALLTYAHNIQHQRYWYQHLYAKGATLIATINEPLTAKPNSYKAMAKITAVQAGQALQPAKGNILIYFKKDSSITKQLTYGAQIAFAKPLQAVQNTGNPGGFNYQRYLLFQGITDQVYLGAQDYVLLPQKNATAFQVWLQRARAYVITALQTYIPGKKEQGVAEALLIGYRNDLDKQLVQSYSRTGVVHIIAISGLHLGMIYWVLLCMSSPLKRKRWYRFVIPIFILLILWTFTFLAGAVPSIMRSAVMFSFIVLGECLQRKPNIYNTLSVSALCLLIINPFYLWDVGFQLSYAAVLSIVVFFKPIYDWLFVENKMLNFIWKLMATNLAAQILTLPIVLFYFHQFPLLFLITNLLVVPLSTVILFLEIFIVFIATWVAELATITGKFAGWLLWLMNSFIEQVEKLPFALWQNIKMDVIQTILLYSIILLLLTWLSSKYTKVLLYALAATLCFTLYTSIDIIKSKRQHKLIVYNVPKSTAVDVIQGNRCQSLMSAAVVQDAAMQNFYLQPARLQYRTSINEHNILDTNNYLLHVGNKAVLIISHSLPALAPPHRVAADAVIITGNPKLYIHQLYTLVNSPIIVFDNSNPAWKIEKWKKDCNNLHLRFHSVAQRGAFVMDW